MRNRVRRRLRAAVTELAPLPAGTYLVGASSAAATVPFGELTASLEALVAAATRDGGR